MENSISSRKLSWGVVPLVFVVVSVEIVRKHYFRNIPKSIEIYQSRQPDDKKYLFSTYNNVNNVP